MTIIESVVSGSIMVGVVILSFQTMLTGAQISQKSTATNDMSTHSRSAFIQLKKEIRSAEYVLQNYKSGSIDAQTGADMISLRVPVFDSTGSKIIGQWAVVNYILKPVAEKLGHITSSEQPEK